MYVINSRFMLFAGMLSLSANPAFADIKGTIDASITLEAGCIINSQNLDNGATTANFGTLSFGVHNTLFVSADAQVTNGGAGIEVHCSPGVTPTLKFDGGGHKGKGTGGGLRAMAHKTTSNQYVTYNLYSDSGYNTVIPLDGDMTLAGNGEIQTVNVYGRAFGGSGLVTGGYLDEITVTLEL